MGDKENQRNNARFEGKRVLDARKAPEGPNEERNNRRNQEGNYVRRNDEDGEGRGRGRGRGRGGRGRGEGGGRGRMEGGGVGRGGKREFERKSGDARTGVKAEDKRGGGGKGNWGTFEDDNKEEENVNNTSVEETPTDGDPATEGETKEKV